MKPSSPAVDSSESHGGKKNAVIVALILTIVGSLLTGVDISQRVGCVPFP